MEEECNYPLIIEGEGNGMLDDIADFELKEIVDETDKLGKSKSYYTARYERDDIFDYRNYNIVE